MIAVILTIAFTRCWRSLMLEQDQVRRLSGAKRSLMWVGAMAQIPWLILGFAVRALGLVSDVGLGKVLYDDGIVCMISHPNDRQRSLKVYAEPLGLLNLLGVAAVWYLIVNAILSIQDNWGSAFAALVLASAAIPALPDFHLIARHRIRGLSPIASGLARAPWRDGPGAIHGQLSNWVSSPTYLIAYEPLVLGVYLKAWPEAIAMQLDDGIPVLPSGLRPPLCLVII